MTKEDVKSASEMIIRTHIDSFKGVYPEKLVNEWIKKWSPEKIIEKMEDNEFYIAIENGSIKGIISLKGNELYMFYVEHRSQGQGIGRKLYNYLEKGAREKGLDHITVQGGEKGVPIYEKFGFKKMKVIHKERVGIKYIDVLMRKELK